MTEYTHEEQKVMLDLLQSLAKRGGDHVYVAQSSAQSTALADQFMEWSAPMVSQNQPMERTSIRTTASARRFRVETMSADGKTVVRGHMHFAPLTARQTYLRIAPHAVQIELAAEATTAHDRMMVGWWLGMQSRANVRHPKN